MKKTIAIIALLAITTLQAKCFKYLEEYNKVKNFIDIKPNTSKIFTEITVEMPSYSLPQIVNTNLVFSVYNIQSPSFNFSFTNKNKTTNNSIVCAKHTSIMLPKNIDLLKIKKFNFLGKTDDYKT